MTGKFHYNSGEVGGYKVPDALLYECGAMLAHGAGCSIGDHLHPTAAIDRSTMTIIERAYAWIEAPEAWTVGSNNRPISRCFLPKLMRRKTMASACLA
jgi:hypothetical protein